MKRRFRSTGSYEPDREMPDGLEIQTGFDPQALTSLTRLPIPPGQVGKGFDPQALTSLTLPPYVWNRYD